MGFLWVAIPCNDKVGEHGGTRNVDFVGERFKIWVSDEGRQEICLDKKIWEVWRQVALRCRLLLWPKSGRFGEKGPAQDGSFFDDQPIPGNATDIKVSPGRWVTRTYGIEWRRLLAGRVGSLYVELDIEEFQCCTHSKNNEF